MLNTPSHATDHFVRYAKNPSWSVCAVERTRQDVTYFSSFIVKSWLNGLVNIGQGLRPFVACDIC